MTGGFTCRIKTQDLMAVPLLSGGELLYFGLMDQKPAPVSERQPLVILTTTRLILRTAVEEDIPILQDLILGDSDVMRFAFSGAPMAGDAAEDFIRRSFTFGGSLTGIAVLTEKPTGEVIGFAGLSPCDALGADDFEIGFVLVRNRNRRGAAHLWVRATQMRQIARAGRSAKCAVHSRAQEAWNALSGDDCGPQARKSRRLRD
jgi:RimJ/RimL family protein N-acetyltransferase